MKRPALQNKQVAVLRMAFRARKVLGTFEKRAPDHRFYSRVFDTVSRTSESSSEWATPSTGGSVGWASGWASGRHAGGREFDSSRTNTQGLKITE